MTGREVAAMWLGTIVAFYVVAWVLGTLVEAVAR